MSAYAVFEIAVVALVGLVCARQALKILMPRTFVRLHALVAAPFGGGQTDASASGNSSQSSACAVGCASACNGCGVTARTTQPLVDQQTTSS